MPPNIHFDSASLCHRHLPRGFCHEEDPLHPGANEPNEKNALSRSRRDHGRRLWQSMVDGSAPPVDDCPEDVRAALASIRILDCPSRNADWLEEHGGNLLDPPAGLVGVLETKAPTDFTARVADFNDNLFYEMQDQRGLEHLGVRSESLAETLGAREFLGSFLATEKSVPQPPHVDYTWEILDRYSPEDLKIGFVPLTREGMFLQVWPRDDGAEQISGQLVYIPYGRLLVLPAHTIHGGGYRTTPLSEAPKGNLRFHLYVARNNACLPAHQTNKYTEPNDKRRELSWRYVDSVRMQDLLECLFV